MSACEFPSAPKAIPHPSPAAWIVVITSSDLAFPTLRLAFPTFRLAFPTLRLAFPTFRLAIPTFRLAFPTLRLAVPTFRSAIPRSVLPIPRTDLAIPRSDLPSARTSPRSLFVASVYDLHRHGQFDRGIRTEEGFFCHPSTACFIPMGFPWFFVLCSLLSETESFPGTF
jgi:hypothetical protein